MKKIFVTVLLMLALAGNASALTMSNNICDSATGNLNVNVSASLWDVLYHGHVVYSVRDSNYVWRTVTFPMNYGTMDYPMNVMNETDLNDVEQYNIGTDKTTIIVAPCN